ncbi:MAG: hypothetical protein ACE5R6_12750 [Candidatus Heimdallarchaeota archaeon]
MLWLGYRTFQDFRQKISFSPTGITLRANGGNETFTWDQIRHIEPLQNLIVIQFPTTAVVLRLSPQKQERVLSLINRYHPLSSTMPKRGHILQDLRGSRSKPLSLMIPYVLVGLGVGATMAAILEGFFLPIFLTCVIGYLCVGGMYVGGSYNEGSILTETGIIDVSNHKQVLQTPALPSIPKTQRRPIPWLSWTDIIHFEIYYDHTVLQSELGRLEVVGGKEVKELIMDKIEFESHQWVLTEMPTQQIQYPKKTGIRVGPLRTYQIIYYSATIGDKKRI